MSEHWIAFSCTYLGYILIGIGISAITTWWLTLVFCGFMCLHLVGWDALRYGAMRGIFELEGTDGKESL